MVKKIDVSKWKNVFPYYIYRRVPMVAAKNYVFEPLESGYWYLYRTIRAKWPEIDAAGITFVPEIFFEETESSINRVHQRMPIPLRLLTSPGSAGVQINAGGQLTATGPRREILFDEIRLANDNLQFILTGQNATPFPAWVDLMIMGYMIPDADLTRWKGTNL